MNAASITGFPLVRIAMAAIRLEGSRDLELAHQRDARRDD
jgi:hypothetical protein